MRRGGTASAWPELGYRRVALVLAAVAALVAGSAEARTILFVGNSFTFGANSSVQAYRPDLVTDLNGEGIGGVPALFKTFANEAKLHWTVSLETSPGKDLAWHLTNRSAVIGRAWDIVILQGYSTLDAEHPGNPTRHIAAAVELARLVKRANREAEVDLVSTWSRADQTYPRGGHWYGRPIRAMGDDIAAGNARALRASRDIAAAIPVGQAWNRAFAAGIADPNPYDGVSFGQLDLWAWDQYHASAAGYYLEALVVFGQVTGVDVRTLGRGERAAYAIGLSPDQAAALQTVAWGTLRQRGG